MPDGCFSFRVTSVSCLVVFHATYSSCQNSQALTSKAKEVYFLPKGSDEMGGRFTEETNEQT